MRQLVDIRVALSLLIMGMSVHVQTDVRVAPKNDPDDPNDQ